MGRLILISGENASGKSLFAERLIGSQAKEKYYIATMKACTEENRARIRKHIAQRDGLGFNTLELAYRVGDAEVSKDAIVLLEDVSNLLANNIFEKGVGEDEVFRDICRLRENCAVVVAVTISKMESDGYDGETAGYINSLNRLNEMLFDAAEVAIEMESGKAIYRKGVEICF